MVEYLVYALLTLNPIITLWSLRILAMQVRAAVADQQAYIDLALDRVLSGNIEGVEPPNPIQAAIGQLLMQRAQQTDAPAIDILRGDDGKFSG